MIQERTNGGIQAVFELPHIWIARMNQVPKDEKVCSGLARSRASDKMVDDGSLNAMHIDVRETIERQK